MNEINNTADYTANFDPRDIAENKTMAILAYLAILVLIPIFAAPNSRYARFHANQGLVLLILSVGCTILTSILGRIPFVGLIGSLISAVVGIGVLVLSIMGIINAVNGQAKALPLIGKIFILK